MDHLQDLQEEHRLQEAAAAAPAAGVEAAGAQQRSAAAASGVQLQHGELRVRRRRGRVHELPAGAGGRYGIAPTASDRQHAERRRCQCHWQQLLQGSGSATAPAPAAIEQKPQLLDSSAMTIAFHQNDQSIAGAAAATNDQCYKDGYWDEIAKFMEVNDPTVLYDCRYA